jgi:hypothetical protein
MLTFTQKQIRNEKKRERKAIKNFQKTNDVSYMRKADKCKEKWMELERNQMVDIQKNNVKITKKNMTEDEVFQEAEEYNLMMKEEGEDKIRIKMKEEAKIKEVHMNALDMLKEKNKQQSEKQEKIKSMKNEFKKEQDNQKDTYFRKMKEEKPNYSDSDIQKNFRRYQFDREKREEYKEQMKFVFKLQGIEENDIDENVGKYFDYLREQKEMDSKNFPICFELDDYLEGYDKKMIEEKVSDLEEPIPEEEVETHSSL